MDSVINFRRKIRTSIFSDHTGLHYRNVASDVLRDVSIKIECAYTDIRQTQTDFWSPKVDSPLSLANHGTTTHGES